MDFINIVPERFLEVRGPRDGEDYFAYLDAHQLIGQGFALGELVQLGSPRRAEPPRKLWRRMVPTLALAIELRARMVAAGARGLEVHAAYRPEGGADDSQHKYNAALDLDLLPGDDRLRWTYVEVAAKLWREHRHLATGIGTYARAGSMMTRRVHIDTGYRGNRLMTGFRCWQGLPGGGWASRPDVLAAAPPPDEAEPGDGWHEIAGVQLAMDAARAADSECVRPWRT